MRWTLSSLMVLAHISLARSATQDHNHLMIRMFSPPYPNALASALAGPASIMRRLFVAFGLMGGLLSPTFAADYDLPVLRGSEPLAPVMTVGPATFTRWSGFYLGGQLSYGGTNTDFSGATAPLVSFSLRNTTLEADQSPSQYQVLGRASGDGFGAGGFIGYNTQWQDLIIGFEGNYTRTSLTATASTTPIARVVSAGSATYSVNLTGTGTLDLTDYASIRGRAGWVLGNLLPYGFAGVAIGRASYSVTSLVSGQQSSGTPPFPNPDGTCTAPSATCMNYSFSNSAGQSNALLYGYSVGLGLDWAVTPNLFLRSEFEFVQFVPLNSITVNIISARVGAGLKF